MDLKDIKRVIQMVEEAQISHFCVEMDGVKIEVKKELTGQISHGISAVPAVIPQQPALLSSAAPAAAVVVPSESVLQCDPKLISIKSQMVGTFYVTSKPDSPPYVKVGDTVKPGQVICIIEAMKLFNEIECEFAGVIEKVSVENGVPVEYGQELFVLRLA
jgi:acetyl-CoA carboxylase biotin carboxyl carrier protein